MVENHANLSAIKAAGGSAADIELVPARPLWCSLGLSLPTCVYRSCLSARGPVIILREVMKRLDAAPADFQKMRKAIPLSLHCAVRPNAGLY